MCLIVVWKSGLVLYRLMSSLIVSSVSSRVSILFSRFVSVGVAGKSVAEFHQEPSVSSS